MIVNRSIVKYSAPLSETGPLPESCFCDTNTAELTVSWGGLGSRPDDGRLFSGHTEQQWLKGAFCCVGRFLTCDTWDLISGISIFPGPLRKKQRAENRGGEVGGWSRKNFGSGFGTFDF